MRKNNMEVKNIDYGRSSSSSSFLPSKWNLWISNEGRKKSRDGDGALEKQNQKRRFISGCLIEKDEEANMDNNVVMVLTEDGRKFEVKNREEEIFEKNPADFDYVDNMSELFYLNEPSVLHTLLCRSEKSIIHTYSGQFLVIVNPYKTLDIYDSKVMEMYKNNSESADKKLPPHVFAVADKAYRAILSRKINQTILITGESGAGKTENTKRIIQYYSKISRSNPEASCLLAEQIILSNSVLEAFGNAGTLRNDNSSRFGKFVTLQFTKSASMSGANIKHYLLERSRIVNRPLGERSFHIFYQLLSGASTVEKELLSLGMPNHFQLLRQSKCFSLKEVDDAQMFFQTKKAMGVMGIEYPDQIAIFKVISAILHLGNVNFVGRQDSSVEVDNMETVEIASNLLEVSPTELVNVLLRKTIKPGSESVETELNIEAVQSSRDALVKELYGGLFDWIVRRFNKVTDHGMVGPFIGILDISGFEISQENSFEQLCINYTNEKLQQFFNHCAFLLEQQEYIKEKIVWKFEDFGMDLKPCIDLIEKPGNLFSLLDEECILDFASDETFLRKLNDRFKNNETFKKPRISGSCFSLKHYAGCVSYSVKNWLVKSKDTLHEGLNEVMTLSRNPVIQEIFILNRAGDMARNSFRGRMRRGLISTIGSKYKNQLAELMNMLSTTEPHFIRCIKPNEFRKPFLFDDELILDQLRCNGVVEGIRLSRIGFPNKLFYVDFVKTFKMLLPLDIQITIKDGNVHSLAQNILDASTLSISDYRLGTSKVFFAAGKLNKLENDLAQKIGNFASIIQRTFRCYIFKKRLIINQMERKHSAVLQRNIKIWLNSLNNDWVVLLRRAKHLVKNYSIDEEISSMQTQLNMERFQNKERLDQIQIQEEKLNLQQCQINTSLEERRALQKRLKEVLRDLQESRETLAFEKASSNTKQLDFQKRIDKFIRDIEEESRLKSQLQLQFLKSQNTLQETKIQSEKLEMMNASMKESVERKENEIQNMVISLEKESMKVKEERERNHNVTNALEEMRDSIIEERRQKDELGNALRDLRTDHFLVQRELQQSKNVNIALSTRASRVLELEDELRLQSSKKESTEEIYKVMRGQMDDLKINLQQTNKENLELKSVNSQMTTKITEAGSEVERLSSNFLKLKEDNHFLQRKVKDSEFLLEEGRRVNNSLNQDLNLSQDRLSDLQNELFVEKRSVVLKERQLNDVQKVVREMVQELEFVKSASRERAELSSELKQQTKELLLDLLHESKIRKSLEESHKALETKISDLNRSQENISIDASARTGFLKVELSISQENLAEENTLRKKAEEYCKQLEKQVQELNQEVIEGSMSQSDLKKRLLRQAEELREQTEIEKHSSESLASEVREARRTISTLNILSNDAANAAEKNKNDFLELKDKFKSVEKDLFAEKEKTFAIKRESQTLRNDIETLQAEMDTKTKFLKNENEKQLNKFKLELEKMHEIVSLFENRKAERERSHEEAVERLKKDLFDEMERAAYLKKKNDSLLEQVKSMKFSAIGDGSNIPTFKKKEKLENHHATDSDLHGKVKYLESKLESVTNQKTLLEKHLAIVEKETNGILPHLTKSLKSLESQETELHSEKREKGLIHVEFTGLQKKYRKLLDSVESLEKDNRELRHTLNLANLEIDDLYMGRRSNHSKPFVRHLQESLTEKEVLVEDFNKQLASEKIAKDTLEQINSELRSQVEKNESKKLCDQEKKKSSKNSTIAEISRLKEEILDQKVHYEEALTRNKKKYEKQYKELDKILENERHNRMELLRENRQLKRQSMSPANFKSPQSNLTSPLFKSPRIGSVLSHLKSPSNLISPHQTFRSPRAGHIARKLEY